MKHAVLTAVALGAMTGMAGMLGMAAMLGATGCLGGRLGDTGEPDPDDSAVAIATQAIKPPPLPWEPEQGTHILGGNPDTLPTSDGNYLHVSSTPTFRTAIHLTVSDSALGAHLIADSATDHYEQDSERFNGMILTASNTSAQLRITAAVEVNATTDLQLVGFSDAPSSTRYTLSYRTVHDDGTFDPWTDYCGGSGAAVPLAGYYDQRRIHHPADAISFACPDAIAQKCVYWGYAPGSGTGVHPERTTAWRTHQACTNMGNANYCMTGKSYTREETPIRILDNDPDHGSEDAGPLGHPSMMPGTPDSWPGNPDKWYIEGGWDENGPICLSRLRWAALQPDECKGVLKDPRKDPEGVFCDDLTTYQLFHDRHALLVNGSMTMDAALQRWQIGKTGDTVSTIRGFFVDRDGDGLPDPDSFLPFQDLNGNSPYGHYVGTDGVVLRHLPGSLDASQMLPLYVQNLAPGADHYLGTTGGGRSDPAFEGYSFLDAAPVTNEGDAIHNVDPLTQCRWPSGDRDSHVVVPATTSACAPLTPAQSNLGYVQPAL